jgi:hypothetical protein
MRIGSIVMHTPQFEPTVRFWQAGRSLTSMLLEDPGGNLLRVVTKPEGA